jgi:hypothetical protein
VALGCAGGPSAADAPVPVTTIAPSPADGVAETAPEPVSGPPLRRLVVLKTQVRGMDCGHDGDFGAHHCAYTAAGVARPAPEAAIVRVLLADPPAIVLAATEGHPAKLLGEAEAVALDCETQPLGEATSVHFGAVTGVVGYRYGGVVEVIRASACNVEPFVLPEALRAAHVLVGHAEGHRKPPHVTRSRDEALAAAEELDRALASGAIDFVRAAAEKSDDRAAAARNGDLGRFRVGSMVPEFERVVLGTPVGERSAFFESAFGFHILERLPP